MTEHRPPACHYDRALDARVTREHRDDCPDPTTHGGCAPCTARHCVVCGNTHATNDHPQTCPTCLGKIRDDLTDIQACYTALAVEAQDAGADGRLVAAAPIPGGTAAVLIGPTVRLDILRVSRHTRDDHAVDRKGHSHDPLPPLAVLAQWEDMWRAWFNQTRGNRRASVSAALAYFDQHLDVMSQETEGPDWLAFTRQIRSLRSSLEHALHDERAPEEGVDCFECGEQLVRRFRDPKRCRHETPARMQLAERLRARPPAIAWLELLRGYGLPAWNHELAAARLPSNELLHLAKAPCPQCNQGGIDDPTAGLSWECPGCRKEYDPGEYATAVRRDLLDNGRDGDGWTHVSMAAEAATTLTGHVLPPATVRKWMDRGKVASLCRWAPGKMWGLRLVYWPDVADEAVEAVRRWKELEQARARRAKQFEAWSEAVDAGEDPAVAGERLRIHPQRVQRFIDERERITA